MGSQKLSEMLQQPYDLYKAGWADDYVLGLINQVRARPHFDQTCHLSIWSSWKTVRIWDVIDPPSVVRFPRPLTTQCHRRWPTICSKVTSWPCIQTISFNSSFFQNLEPGSAWTWSRWTSSGVGSTGSPPTTGGESGAGCTPSTPGTTSSLSWPTTPSADMLRYLGLSIHQWLYRFACQNTACPLQNAAAFIKFTISKQVLQIYESPEDLDLWSAGVTERPLPGSMVSFINHHTTKRERRTWHSFS